MPKKLQPIPTFKSEDEERKFWATHSSVDYLDWSKAQRVSFPNLKPSTETISLRLPLSLLEDIKVEANKRAMPYQSLIKAKLYTLFDKSSEEYDPRRKKIDKK